MQRACLCYYTIITYYYVIITLGSIIIHYYIFQSPELADASDAFPTWRAFERIGLDPTHVGSLPEPGFAQQEALLPPLRRAALAFTGWRAFSRAG